MTIKDLKKMIEDHDDNTEVNFSICFEDWDNPESSQTWFSLMFFDIGYCDADAISFDFAFKNNTVRKNMTKMLERMHS